MTIKFAETNSPNGAKQTSNFSLLELRIVVGYLGEEAQFGWWNSSFFSATSESFLSPVFPRTRFLSQAEGVRAAACKLHDERIGVGKVFHLFRLPEELEQSFHHLLHSQDISRELGQHIESREIAIEFLRSNFDGESKGAIGPVSVGDVSQASSKTTVNAIGHQYLQGFTTDTPVFPFLKEG